MSEAPPGRKNLIIGGLLLVLILSAGISLLRGGEDREEEAVRLHEECGTTMAALAHQALDRGKRVLVLENDGRTLPPQQREWMQGQIESFYAALDSNLEITKHEVGSSDEAARQAEFMGRASNPEELRHIGFAPFAKTAPEVDVIVSFVGEPVVDKKGAEAWTHLPPVVCMSFSGKDVPPLIEAGVLAAAIAPRHSPISIKDAKSKSWFEVMYEIVTPENLAQWIQ